MRLIFYEAFVEKSDAVRREDYLKTTKGKSTLRMMLRNALQITEATDSLRS
jgi:predicted GIY-YIG superfamily endonuclease